MTFICRGKQWPFSIFVAALGSLRRKYTPKSDFSFLMRHCGKGKTAPTKLVWVLTCDHMLVVVVPLIISEVVSDEKNSDRWRMLLQAIALVRMGNYLLKEDRSGDFFVIAIYVTNAFVAERYFLYQPDKLKRKVGERLLCETLSDLALGGHHAEKFQPCQRIRKSNTSPGAVQLRNALACLCKRFRPYKA